MNDSKCLKALSTIDLSYENQLIKADFMRKFSDLYDSNQLISAPVIEGLEQELAAYCGTRHCSLTGAGTMALQMAAGAIGIRPGDEVVVPANTFLATAVAMHHAGAKIVLADVDPDTWNLSAATVRPVITPRSKAICLVHLYGNLADPEEFAEFGLPVIEDASHAFGGTMRGRRAGSLGSVAGFSAGPIKGFGGLGHAGFVTYDNDEWHGLIKAGINNGQTSRHWAEVIGHNFRIDTVNALFLACKLSCWEHLLDRRKQVMGLYDQAFDKAGIDRQARLIDADAALWVYVIRVAAAIRDRVRAYLKDRYGIDTLVQYTYTINQLPIWPDLAANPAMVPVSERLCREIISLPVHAGVSVEDAAFVGDKVIEAVTWCRTHGAA
jgi:UDP-2-acetamido-2-deoxy-ribo-hexuluronate aminotransferase